MIRRRNRDRPTERDLARYADGSLTGEARARVARAVTDSPDLQAELQAQHYALDALHSAASERAPLSLRARVAPAHADRPRRRRTLTLTAAGAVATVVAVVAIVGGGAAESPSVANAAVLGTRPAVGPAPQAARGSVTFPQPRAAGLRFPYWADHFGWKAIGTRQDRLRGRRTTTVFYRRDRRVIAYTIVDGPPLRIGASSRVSTKRGTTLHSLPNGNRRVVTWLRRGHTCVLSGARTTDVALQRLAAWRGGGGIAY